MGWWFRRPKPDELGRCAHVTCTPWQLLEQVSLYNSSYQKSGRPIGYMFIQKRSCLMCGFTELSEKEVLF
ncbi:hypothetical protein L3Y25_gp053 [Gordonia phage Syleon]|uniref:Uncharacterized protein n=3 Tax=Octobienvirus TaxID=3044779 RepID=A0AAE8Y656_9CAUD|nr:hypothetical protein L3Y23_gp051 [Gordonia Phage Sephiroth]YP_010246571.1 hypothetical protein L3Y24_gp052 [Gordonia phage Kudefre]YP_010246712.1 hypothetical protein L3Y25_gp053 [Gordonia phage Syleon]QGH75782.1 hypothetical protein SEA_SYLEON_53 [Gordonia phage Syleon]QNN99476.1 hypothetical protein SEA_SEPHIROTH_51 [Gordonia Phage Sephiroth]UDL15282.1 hypothetical protein SEA_KUDEFRE_52 [Gordonia phage Kudefre]